MKDTKKTFGQFYTTNFKYILQDFDVPCDVDVIEPFVGNGDLIKWLDGASRVEMYDIDPKIPGTIKRDTLKNPPNYSGKWIITNPPFLARNKSENKDLYDLYKTNDLYKCFIESISKENYCDAGIIIIPAGFFMSSRPTDIKCRDNFMKKYLVHKIRYFEETVFSDTTITVVALNFSKNKSSHDLINQDILWEFFPTKETKIFTMSKKNDWIVGGEIHKINNSSRNIISRYIINKVLSENDYLTFMTLRALDSGTADNKISLDYNKDFVYQGKASSRSFATIIIKNKKLSAW